MRLICKHSWKLLNQISSKAPCISPSQVFHDWNFGRIDIEECMKKKLQVCGKRNSTIQSSYCVPFNSLVPCHLFFPRESTHLLAVLTWHFFSDGLKAPRSSSSINRDVDHIQVRFHVKERCFFIQKAILNILDES